MEQAPVIRPSRLTPNLTLISLASLSRKHLPVANPDALTIMLKVSIHTNVYGFGREASRRGKIS